MQIVGVFWGALGPGKENTGQLRPKAYAMMCAYSVAYGFFGGAFIGLFSVVIAELFGVANLPKAMGVSGTSWMIGGVWEVALG